MNANNNAKMRIRDESRYMWLIRRSLDKIGCGGKETCPPADLRKKQPIAFFVPLNCYTEVYKRKRCELGPYSAGERWPCWAARPCCFLPRAARPCTITRQDLIPPVTSARRCTCRRWRLPRLVLFRKPGKLCGMLRPQLTPRPPILLLGIALPAPLQLRNPF